MTEAYQCIKPNKYIFIFKLFFGVAIGVLSLIYRCSFVEYVNAEFVYEYTNLT